MKSKIVGLENLSKQYKINIINIDKQIEQYEKQMKQFVK